MLTYGCANQSHIIKSIDFENYIKDIPAIDLPFSTTCGACCNTKKINIDTLLIKKFNPDKLAIVAKLTEFENTQEYFMPVLLII